MIHNDTRVIKRTLWALEHGIKYIVHQGGTSSGKTFGGLYALLTYLLYDRRHDQLKASVVSENVPHLKRGALRDFETIISELGLTSQIKYNRSDKTFKLPNGTIIEFFAVDNEEKAKSGKRDLLFANEITSLKHQIFWQLAIRTRESIIMDYNPSAEFWWHDKLLPTLRPQDFLFTRTTYRDNPSLSADQVRAIESITDPYLARVYKEGKLGIIKGLIYTNLRLVDHMPHELSKEGYGLDYGYTIDPTALVHAGVHQGEIYAEELIYASHMLNSDIIERMDSLGVSKRIPIIADSAEPKSNDEIRIKGGYNVKPVSKGKDSLEYGIQLLQQQRINITRESLNGIAETRKYKRDDNGRPIDSFNHFLDALRYWAMHNIGTSKKGRIRAIGRMKTNSL